MKCSSVNCSNGLLASLSVRRFIFVSRNLACLSLRLMLSRLPSLQKVNMTYFVSNIIGLFVYTVW